ncbi:hypothetical protein AB0F81_03215 [Actinoplanes sp. NPDC024001]|uniref:hypothetical protein n=1 Tax=Actinoplanes sp. NPDC024001 TaxID=3154598 RepID=UPI0033E53462
MTMHEGMLRPGCATVRDGRLVVAVHLPWYRSLPLSCLESVEVNGEPGRISPGHTWDLRDPLEVSVTAPNVDGPIEVTVAIRIPYIQQAPGVPLVQRATARTEVTVR